MKKFFMMLAVAAFILPMMTACSDDDDNSQKPDPELQAQDPQGKNTEAGIVLYRMVTMLTESDSLPDNWKDATFDVDYGTALSAAEPSVRLCVVEDISAAMLTYNMLTGRNIAKGTTTDTWKDSNVGSVTWNAVNGEGVFATIEFDVKQLPGLSEIRFVPESAIGENASFEGSYYQMGDVVMDNENQYWICVCPASANDAQSYWVNLFTPTSNLKQYSATSKYKEQIVPDKLGFHEHIYNIYAMLSYMVHFAEKVPMQNSQPSQLVRNFYSRVAHNWKVNNMWSRLFPGGYDWAKYLILTEKKLTFFHTGHSHYSWGGVMDLYYITGTGDMNSMDYVRSNTVEYDMKQYSFNALTSFNDQGMPWPSEGLFIRCKTGKELSSNTFFTPKSNEPLPGVTSYRDFRTHYFDYGDLVIWQSTTGNKCALCMCIQPAGAVAGDNNAHFIALTKDLENRQELSADNGNKISVTKTNGAITIDQAKAAAHLIGTIIYSGDPEHGLPAANLPTQLRAAKAYYDNVKKYGIDMAKFRQSWGWGREGRTDNTIVIGYDKAVEESRLYQDAAGIIGTYRTPVQPIIITTFAADTQGQLYETTYTHWKNYYGEVYDKYPLSLLDIFEPWAWRNIMGVPGPLEGGNNGVLRNSDIYNDIGLKLRIYNINISEISKMEEPVSYGEGVPFSITENTSTHNTYMTDRFVLGPNVIVTSGFTIQDVSPQLPKLNGVTVVFHSYDSNYDADGFLQMLDINETKSVFNQYLNRFPDALYQQ